MWLGLEAIMIRFHADYKHAKSKSQKSDGTMNWSSFFFDYFGATMNYLFTRIVKKQ